MACPYNRKALAEAGLFLKKWMLLTESSSWTTRYKNSVHTIHLLLGEHVHATIIGIVHIVHPHFQWCAGAGAAVIRCRATAIGCIVNRRIVYQVRTTGSIAPDVAQV